MTGTLKIGSKTITTLADLVIQRAITEPDKQIFTFLEDGEDIVSIVDYRTFDQRARAIAAVLLERYQPGDRMLLLFHPGLDFIQAFWGCLYAGMIAVPTYPPNLTKVKRSLPRFLSIIKDSAPEAVLSTGPIIELSKPILESAPEIQSLDWIATESISNHIADTWRRPEIGWDTLAFLQYTSGSTALPKGVMVSHGNLLSNSEMIFQAFAHSPEDKMVSWLPAYHDMGLIGGIIQPVYAGASVVLMSPLHFLQRPHRWLKAITKYNVTVSGAPNFGYDWCVRRVKPRQMEALDLRTWRLAFNGAEPVRPETLRRFTETFAPCGFRPETHYPCYGLAEATLFVTGGLPDQPPTIIQLNSRDLMSDSASHSLEGEKNQEYVSCGRNWLEQEILIVDPDTLEVCGPGCVGEIWVSGQHVAHGYWQNPTATSETFQAYLPGTKQGPFMRTGDLGFFMEGELYIAGRLKDLIIIDGLNHYPQDIELTVEGSHPGVRPDFTAAFSIEEKGSEKLVVVAEFQRQYRDEIDDARKAILQAIAEEHEIRAHDIVLIKTRTIPKTASGKIQRHLCKAEYLSGQLREIGSS
jgi:acyl-CoA synthetase (AMP-forming)/AMP-acid ligase II